MDLLDGNSIAKLAIGWSGAIGVGIRGDWRQRVVQIDMQASFAFVVGMNGNQIQYPLRKVSPCVDRALRQRAQEQQHKSLN